MRYYLIVGVLFSCSLGCLERVGARDALVLENAILGLSFDVETGVLTGLENKLVGASFAVSGDFVVVEGQGFRLDLEQLRPASVTPEKGLLQVRYVTEPLDVEVSYRLGVDSHYAEKRVVLVPAEDCGLVQVVLSQPAFSGDGLSLMEYRYPKFGRAPGTEPSRTFFGRAEAGGFFVGVEEPFDSSTLSGNQVTLGYAPSLKLDAGQRFACEPAYLGVYKNPHDEPTEGLPLWSESQAMVAMTSSILGPPRHGLVPMACGWHSEMSHDGYATQAEADADAASLDFLASCGIDWCSDSHPWGGETEKLHTIKEGDKYEIGPFNQQFLKHAREVGVKLTMWPTMNNSHPWSKLGAPLRPDRPDWLLTRAPVPGESPLLSRNAANCLANSEFLQWLIEINLQGLASGFYDSWVIDGSFFGDGGWFSSIVSVDCTADGHDHLPGNSNYASQRALARLIAAVRAAHPEMYIFTCRPPMDLGVWALENVDVCFTLLESGTAGDKVSPLPGLAGQPPNVVAGDHIRTWSRARVHHDFFPHYVDQPLLFPSRSDAEDKPSNWPRGNLDYILLSALSSSPNQLFYMPTKTGIPQDDKSEIRLWLDWGRENEEYLKVRRDLPASPAAGRVDGSAHIVGEGGVVFFFNPNKNEKYGEFTLNEESIGLRTDGLFEVAQEYPPSTERQEVAFGQVIRWGGSRRDSRCTSYLTSALTVGRGTRLALE